MSSPNTPVIIELDLSPLSCRELVWLLQLFKHAANLPWTDHDDEEAAPAARFHDALTAVEEEIVSRPAASLDDAYAKLLSVVSGPVIWHSEMEHLVRDARNHFGIGGHHAA